MVNINCDWCNRCFGVEEHELVFDEDGEPDMLCPACIARINGMIEKIKTGEMPTYPIEALRDGIDD